MIGMAWRSRSAGSGHRGEGKRATINSYMYGDARGHRRHRRRAGKPDIAAEYRAKAGQLRRLVLEKLWDEEAQFFKVLPRGEGADAGRCPRTPRLHPLVFRICPPPDKGYEVAWKQLMDPQGFRAPFGPTTAEQRHPGFTVSYQGHECQWNGPSWPFATAVTLTALANVLNDYPQDSITRRDYFETLKTYTKSHRLKREDGAVVPWIDENLNPFTGDWIARTRLKSWNNGTWDPGKGGVERGKDYNHSTYCDLIITGLVGLRPQAGRHRGRQSPASRGHLGLLLPRRRALPRQEPDHLLRQNRQALRQGKRPAPSGRRQGNRRGRDTRATHGPASQEMNQRILG